MYICVLFSSKIYGAYIPSHIFVLGAINMSEIVDVQFSTKTAVSISACKSFIGKRPMGGTETISTLDFMDHESEVSSGDPNLAMKQARADLAESMIVFKVTSAKKRRYVLAVPYNQVIQVSDWRCLSNIHFLFFSLYIFSIVMYVRE